MKILNEISKTISDYFQAVAEKETLAKQKKEKELLFNKYKAEKNKAMCKEIWDDLVHIFKKSEILNEKTKTNRQN